MNRFLILLSTTLLLVTGISQNSFAQSDDVYYDPAKDKGKENNSEQNNESSNAPAESADKTDGYSNDNSAYKYDLRDNYSSNNSDYYGSDVSYDEDYESYYYTTNLHRYYGANYGVSYYNYSFTPSYYYGYSNWNSRVVVSVNPWYNDTWWRWNRHHRNTIYVYDPYYDPYWNWNMGWNSAYYTNSWGNSNWGYYSCNYYGWDYNSWAYNWGSGCGYGQYNNGYNNGYWNGYNNGYNDGWNTASGYNPYYYYGHHHKDLDAPGKTGTGSTKPIITSGTSINRTPVDMHTVNIPKAGIQKPIYQNTGVVKPREGVIVNANTASPYNENKPDVVVKPSEPITQAPKGWQNNNEQQRDNNLNVTSQQEPKAWQPSNSHAPVERTESKQNNGWTSTPPQNWGNHPAQRDNSINEISRENNLEGRAQQQPKENRWNEPSRPVEQSRNIEQPRNYQQQRPGVQPRQIEQPRQVEQRREVPQQRNFEQRPMEQRAQPRNEQPHSNSQPTPQRNPAPSNNGGSLKRH